MAGKHEPPSKRSFWFSLTASTLKVVIIIGAVVAGVLVLARSFENAVAPTTPTTSSTPSVAPSPQAGGGGGGGEPTTDDQAGVNIGIYNGTDTEGLAKDVEKTLRSQSGYSVVELGNATETVDATTIYYVKSKDREAAEALASVEEFSSADVLRLPKDTTVIPEGGSEEPVRKDVQVAIFIGDDFA